MVDIDGAVMPSFFLIMLIGYFRLRKMNFQFRIFNFQNLIWIGLLIIGAIGGFFVKASFVIAIGALALDFAFEKNVFSDRKKILKYLLFMIGGAIALGLLLLLAKLIFPFFNLEASVKYWEHFFKLGGRGWLQTFIQFAKSMMYTSPLLVLSIIFVDKEIFKKMRVFFIFIGLGLLFYLVLFDFSIGALDRYFQFLIIPLCIIAGSIFSQNFSKSNNSPSLAPLGPSLITREGIAIGVITIIIFSLQFLNHFVPPLYPKTEWLARLVSLKWDFLFPFTGGSGPTGFYISFLFIALIWVTSLILVRKKLLLGILVLGILYNAVFIEEYLFGKINGSPYDLFRDAKEFIIKDQNIKLVLVYNDIGGYEIQKLGKYERRLYAAPQFEDTYKDFFKTFSGQILYINIPKIGDNNFYYNYLNSCKNIYERKDGYITAQVLDCNNAKIK